MTTYTRDLVCRVCGARVPLGASYICDECFGPLEIAFDYEAIKRDASQELVAAGPRTLWRYRQLLPDIGPPGSPVVDLGTGCTPLIHAERLGAALGLNRLYIKNDAVNPSYSFKDRAVSVATTAARHLGFDTIACASTGNLANSVAAHAAKAGLNAFVFIPANLEEAKILASSVYEPNVVAVEGNYDDVNRLCTLVADEYGWGFVNINLRPFYAEGAKTLAFEVAEELGWQAPDAFVAPMASGSLLVKIAKGFRELARVGLAEPKTVRVNGAQAAGCSPIAAAFRSGTEEITPQRPDTIAKSLAIGTPADGPYALREIRGSGGQAVAVADQEIVEGMKLLARTEGIFAETAAGVTIAALKRLAEQGAFGRDEVVVAYVTGNGLKTTDALLGHLSPVLRTTATLRSFEDALGRGVYQKAA